MKKISLLALIFIAVLVFCVAGVAQAKKGAVPEETVATALTSAQSMLTTEQDALNSLPSTVSEKVVQSLARRINKAERRLNMAMQEKKRGDGKTALRLIQDATTILEQVDKLIKKETE